MNTDPPYNVKVEPRSNNAIAAGLSSFGDNGTAARQHLYKTMRDPEHAPEAGGGLTHHQAFDLARGKSKFQRTTKKLRPKDRPLENDFVSDEAFEKLLHAWFGNIARVLLPGRCFYIWGGYANCGNYPPVLKACELYFSQAIIWVKEHPVLTRKDFMGNHEWAFYGWRAGAGHKFYGPNNAKDVWPIKKVNPQSMVHLPRSLSSLPCSAIQYSSLPGRERPGPLRRIGFHADRLRADQAACVPHGIGHAVLRRDPAAVGRVRTRRGLRLEETDLGG